MQLASAGRHSRSVVREVEGITESLARFRYNLRRFLRFSEKAARQFGVTPQQHQMMLGVAGFTGRGSATVSELAEFLQERHNSVVGLVERAVSRGLVRRDHDATDRRLAVISLTSEGKRILSRLSELHEEELRHARQDFVFSRRMRAQTPVAKNGKERPAFSLPRKHS